MSTTVPRRWAIVVAVILTAAILGPSTRLQAQIDGPPSDAAPQSTSSTPKRDEAVAPAVATTEAPHAAEAAEDGYKTLAVVALSAQTAQPLQQMLALLTGVAVEGIDPTKPWGALVLSDGTESAKVYCLPVTAPERMLGLIEAQMQAFGAQFEDTDSGSKKLATPFGQTLYFLPRDGWMFVSPSEAALGHLPDDPTDAFGRVLADYSIGARIRLSELPESDRQEMIDQMRAVSQQDLENRKDQLTENELEIYRRQSELMLKESERWIAELEEVTLGGSTDPQQLRAYIDVACRFRPGSSLAAQIAEAGQPRTNFAGFYQSDAAITANLAGAAEPIWRFLLQLNRDTLPTIRAQAERVVDEQQIPDTDARDSLQAALEELLIAVEATLASNEFDGGLALRDEAGGPVFVAGVMVKQPDHLEAALRQLEPRLPLDPQDSTVHWNAAEDKGVRFHTFRLAVPETDPRWREQFGDAVDVTVGVGKEAAYLALGKGNLAALRQAIDASRAESQKEVPPLDASFALGQLLPLAGNWVDDESRQSVDQLVAQLKQGGGEQDHIRLTATLRDGGIRYRLEAEEGVLQALAQLGMAAAPLPGGEQPMMWPPQQ